MEIISREEAIKKGLTRYFTGVPCINGHVSERSTADRNCRACVNEKRRKKTQFKVDFHKYRPDFKLICYGCKKEIIREGQKARNGAFYCSISDTYKERNYCSKRCQKVWYTESGKRSVSDKRRYQNDPEYRKKVAEAGKLYRLNNPEKYNEQKRNYVDKNRDKVNAYKRKYGQFRRDTDFQFRLQQALRKRLWGALGGRHKSANTIKLLGAEIPEVALHLEKQFKEGMSWENYNFEGWHVDHIRPCESFDFLDYEQQFVCFNWRNLQPIWGKENMSKQNSYTKEDEKIWVKRMRELGFEGELFLKYSP